MLDPLHSYRCLLEGEIILDSTTPVNTSGAFCDLLVATHLTAGKLALKRPRGDYNKQLLARIESEARVWAVLKHPRILQFLGIYKINGELFLVSALAENGSLPMFLRRRPDVNRGRLVVEIAEGLAYLHQCGIIHGDLKGNNVLICRGEHVQLCDFGLAKHVTSRTSTSLRGVGSIPWQSPELLQDGCKRTFQSDVYAFGITVYEVLSGAEPYSHHTGIASIITAVMFNGERPPKDPLAAPDGSSYMQFWDEASKCWAEASSARPRIVDVLNRLDHRRAEALVTSQQRALEESLILPIQGTPPSQLSPTHHLFSQHFDEADKRDTLGWARQIRARMSSLVNAQQPLCRFPPKVIVLIIKNDLGPSAWKYWRNWSSSFNSCRTVYTGYVVRCAQLGMVCRAWRDAIDNTPELARYILVDGPRKNIEYVKRYNRDGPLDVLLHEAGHPTRVEPSSFLGPLVNRLCSLTIFSTDLCMKPAPFPMLRAVRIYGSRVHDTFAADLLGMLHASQGVAELILHSISGGIPGTDDSPPSRINHSGLQRVRLTKLSPPLHRHILHCLGLESSTIIRADKLVPECLSTPDSAIGDWIRSLGRTGGLTSHLDVFGTRPNQELPGVTTNDHTGHILFRHTLHNSALPHDRRSPVSESASEWGLLKTENLTIPHMVDIIRILQESGVELETATLKDWEDGVPNQLLSCLSPVTRLILADEAWGTISRLGQPSPKDSESTDGPLQFLCPNLTVLVVESHRSSTFLHSELCTMVRKRQSGTNPTNGPAKLRKIGLPSDWIEQNDFTDPAFKGIEIYSTT